MFEQRLGFSSIPFDKRKLTPDIIAKSSRSTWVPLSQSMFPQDSLGRRLFGEVPFLEGRKRAPYVLDRPMSDLFTSTRRGKTNPFGDRSIRAMLEMPEDALKQDS